MLIDELEKLYLSELTRLQREVEAFDSDEALWEKKEGISNSAGNLVLHLCGNLRHFIGHVIGKEDYQRDREHEFSREFATKQELLVEIELTAQSLRNSFGAISDEVLAYPYPIEVFGETMSYGYFLIHLQGHLNYHLGQINYYRRLKT